MKLYDYLPSGNSYKVRLLLSYLGIGYTHIPIDIHKGETQTPDYLTMNPAGQIPLLQLEDGRTLAESNAILMFLAEDTPYIPLNALKCCNGCFGNNIDMNPVSRWRVSSACMRQTAKPNYPH